MQKQQGIRTLSHDEIECIAGGALPYLAVAGIYIAVHLTSEFLHHHT
ncbi:hypothetical protein [Porphyrobacter sp. TH134]|nr:hypothetical protein [Porphyrobacter sp. TH134]